MSYKNLIKIVLLLFVFISIGYLIFNDKNKLDVSNNDIKSETQNIANGYVIYYFHTTYRCYSCKTMEQYAKEVVDNNFSKEIKNGTLKWLKVNFDSEVNKHYIKEYNLFSKSLIIAFIKDGNIERWKNLNQVWTLINSQKKTKEHIRSEISKFMENK